MEKRVLYFNQDDFTHLIPKHLHNGMCFGHSLFWVNKVVAAEPTSLKDCLVISKDYIANTFQKLDVIIECQDEVEAAFTTDADAFVGSWLDRLNYSAFSMGIKLCHRLQYIPLAGSDVFFEKFIFLKAKNTLFQLLSNENIYAASGCVIIIRGGRVKRNTVWTHAIACYLFDDHGEEYCFFFDPNNGGFVVSFSNMERFLNGFFTIHYPGAVKCAVLGADTFG